MMPLRSLPKYLQKKVELVRVVFAFPQVVEFLLSILQKLPGIVQPSKDFSQSHSEAVNAVTVESSCLFDDAVRLSLS